MTIKICRLKTPGRSLKPICKLSADPGPCNANITRYRWDPQQGCTTFNYGGCGGNANRFKTRKKCQKTCSPSSKSKCNIVPYVKRLVIAIRGIGSSIYDLTLTLNHVDTISKGFTCFYIIYYYRLKTLLNLLLTS